MSKSHETPFKMLHIRLTFTNDVLGTASANPDIYSEYIASKSPAPDMTRAEEIEAIGVEAYEEKSMTVFPRKADDPDQPVFWDYQIRGFFKEACAMCQRSKNQYAWPASLAIKAYKKVIDGTIFIAPRQIPINMHGLKVDTLERPLRAQTAQGERVALAKSEQVPDTCSLEFYICDYSGGGYEAAIREWLDYGFDHGMGQWRNSGKGTFVWEELENRHISVSEWRKLRTEG